MTQVKLMVDLGNSETRAVAQIVEEGKLTVYANVENL